ncbi:MAG: hypothetical protein IPO92_01345 [Saprospiraceae bacterium]|nr:hypothetical protein [Saprospiraceae bacterium]
MKSLKILSLFLLFAFTSTSCSKDDTKAPVINITEPIDGAKVTAGTNLPVKGTITDDTELSEIIVAGNKITTFTSKTSHTLSLDLIIPGNAPKGDTNIEITATDKNNNKATKTIKLTIQ